MSAYVCGIPHFKALALYAAARSAGGLNVDPRYIEGCKHIDTAASDLAATYANLLYRENIRSVLYRYPSDTWDTMPGSDEKPETISITGRDRMRFNLKPVAILKLCNGLEYQSCETPDWKSTTACAILNAIRDSAIRDLPGYDDAPWELSTETA